MDFIQKRTAILLAVIGLMYFTAFIFPNARGARSVEMLTVFSGDETITYPYVVHMLTTPKDIHDLVWRLFIYGDYHYGYLFYFFSFLSILPVKLFAGSNFTEYVQLNLLLLRQLISVLPMIFSLPALSSFCKRASGLRCAQQRFLCLSSRCRASSEITFGGGTRTQ